MTATRGRGDAFALAALVGVLVASSFARPLLPIDETRYIGVAWEMWVRGDLLVPHLNGEPYHHKPPLLFWLMHLGWALFGVSEWWPRLISPLFAAATLALVVGIGARLWPGQPQAARMAPFMLLSAGLYTCYASALMFDAMLTFFVALGLLGLVLAWQATSVSARDSAAAALASRPVPRGFALFAIGLAGALYSKGPVALLHLLPLALVAPWWMREQQPDWRRWYGGVALAVAVAAALILAWALPAASAGGAQYRDAILWGQTAGRVVDSFAHVAPWWYYLAWLPLLLAPWLLWPRWWRGLGRAAFSESGTRFVLFGAVFSLIFFSVVSGKRPHYLLPEFPLFALLAARGVAGAARLGEPGRWSLAVPALTLGGLGAAAIALAPALAARSDPAVNAAPLYGGAALALVCAAWLIACRPSAPMADVRRIATASVIAVHALLATGLLVLREPFDVSEVAARLQRAERAGHALATVEGTYHAQWAFAGRLERRLDMVRPDQVPGWLASHPNGRVVFLHRRPQDIPQGVKVELSMPHRGARLAVLAAAD